MVKSIDIWIYPLLIPWALGISGPLDKMSIFKFFFAFSTIFSNSYLWDSSLLIDVLAKVFNTTWVSNYCFSFSSMAFISFLLVALASLSSWDWSTFLFICSINIFSVAAFSSRSSRNFYSVICRECNSFCKIVCNTCFSWTSFEFLASASSLAAFSKINLDSISFFFFYSSISLVSTNCKCLLVSSIHFAVSILLCSSSSVFY